MEIVKIHDLAARLNPPSGGAAIHCRYAGGELLGESAAYATAGPRFLFGRRNEKPFFGIARAFVVGTDLGNIYSRGSSSNSGVTIKFHGAAERSLLCVDVQRCGPDNIGSIEEMFQGHAFARSLNHEPPAPLNPTQLSRAC